MNTVTAREESVSVTKQLPGGSGGGELPVPHFFMCKWELQLLGSSDRVAHNSQIHWPHGEESSFSTDFQGPLTVLSRNCGKNH